jgi:hypothetical protein
MRFTCCFVQGCVGAVLEQASSWDRLLAVQLHDKFLHTPSHPSFLGVFPVGGLPKVVESSKQGHAAFVVMLNRVFTYVRLLSGGTSRNVRKKTLKPGQVFQVLRMTCN